MGVFSDALRNAGGPERAECVTRLGDKEIRLFALPLTALEIDKLMRRHPDFSTRPSMSAMVDLIISKAEDEQGEKAFDVGDKPLLMKQTINWINGVRSALFPNENEDMSAAAIDDEKEG